MTADELDGVATFYNMIFRRARRPARDPRLQQRHAAGCSAPTGCARSCRRGSASDVGETSADGRFTLLPIVCLGACDHAPALMIDDDLHGDVDPANAVDAAREVSRRWNGR